MNFDEITRALSRATDPAELYRLQTACETRRTEIRERLAAISEGSGPFLHGPARDRALREGIAAVAALDREGEALDRELSLVNMLEIRIVEEARR